MKHISTLALAAALIAGSIGVSLAQSGGDAGANRTTPGAAVPSQSNQSGTADQKPASGGMSGAATGMNNDKAMGECPTGQMRATAADGTKGPCKAM